MNLSKSNIAVVIWVLLVGAFAAFMLTSEPATPHTTMKPLGSVLDVSACVSGKHSHLCHVRITSHEWQTDLGVWPGEILQRGDLIAMRTDQLGWRKDTWMCRNGVCRSISSCWSWMPCWDKS